jgi:Fe-S-cluster-containing dehydrogenase component
MTCEYEIKKKKVHQITCVASWAVWKLLCCLRNISKTEVPICVKYCFVSHRNETSPRSTTSEDRVVARHTPHSDVSLLPSCTTDHPTLTPAVNMSDAPTPHGALSLTSGAQRQALRNETALAAVASTVYR